jgi:hypothetical protein
VTEEHPLLPSETAVVQQPLHPLAVPEKKQKRRVKIDPANDPGGELEQLLIVYNEASARAAEAGSEADDAKDAVKALLKGLLSAIPGPPVEAVDVAADPHGRYKGYTMTLKGGKRFNSKGFREAVGDELYEQFEVEITPTWELREAQTGQRRPRKLCRTQG